MRSPSDYEDDPPTDQELVQEIRAATVDAVTSGPGDNIRPYKMIAILAAHLLTLRETVQMALDQGLSFESERMLRDALREAA